MQDAMPSRELPDRLWDRRWLLAGQTGLALVALVVFVVVVRPTWHWGLFLWGVSVGVVASVLIIGIGALATRDGKVSPESQRRARRRLVVYAEAWILLGVLAGFGAAIADTAWPDVLLLASLVVTSGLMAIVVITFRRRTHDLSE